MKLLGRGGNGDADGRAAADNTAEPEDVSTAATGTAPKGRPTPKRSQGRRGPVAPAPMTTSEARARRKAMSGPKLSKEERKEQRIRRRALVTERREKMMAGDDAYLQERDRGPLRRYVRDIVDSRRGLLGLFMPATLAMLFVMIAVPPLSYYMSTAMMVLMLLMIIDAVWLGRKVSNMVDVKFPENTESRWKLGFYAALRNSQMRRMRVPRPVVSRGAQID